MKVAARRARARRPRARARGACCSRVDVGRWREQIAAGDRALAPQPGRRRSTGRRRRSCPAIRRAASSGSATTSSCARAIQRVRRSRSARGIGLRQRPEQRSLRQAEAEAALEDVVLHGSPSQVAQADVLLGVLAFANDVGARRASTTPGERSDRRRSPRPPGSIRRTRAAKFDLELTLRALAPTGTRPGSNPSAGGKGPGTAAPAPGCPGAGSECSARSTFLTPLAGLLARARARSRSRRSPSGCERVRRARRALLASLATGSRSAGCGRSALAARPAAARARARAAGAAHARLARRRAPTRRSSSSSTRRPRWRPRRAPHAPTRLAQAKRIAIDGRHRSSAASRSASRASPIACSRTLFPTIDRAVVDSTVRVARAPTARRRARRRASRRASARSARSQRSSFFTAAQRHRALLLITDGESRPVRRRDAGPHARAPRPACTWSSCGWAAGGDRLYAADGRPGSVYRADPEGARQAVAQLVSATGGRSFDAAAAGVAAALRSALGSGPTTRITSEPETRALAPYVVLLSLIPLLIVLASTGGTVRASRRLS